MQDTLSPSQVSLAVIFAWSALVCVITGLHMWLSLFNLCGGLTFMAVGAFFGTIMLALCVAEH
ncbi:hypothetical protein GCM10007868_14200 [Gluconobacter frateurii]|uniref:Uncharacterized protein n=1 Tax=Gluconobacter frateurii NRIC 0228 TaxID=1307946 RepID=A0ABQ0QEE0_9PROT|nr:hypothetical protein AA0228_2549 [Gluconobacter frateurii NRIC 0228]GLP90345.1 hypothetical protein GCM10007868_14200 [Gluconobacter frateurii]